MKLRRLARTVMPAGPSLEQLYAGGKRQPYQSSRCPLACRTIGSHHCSQRALFTSHRMMGLLGVWSRISSILTCGPREQLVNDDGCTPAGTSSSRPQTKRSQSSSAAAARCATRGRPHSDTAQRDVPRANSDFFSVIIVASSEYTKQQYACLPCLTISLGPRNRRGKDKLRSHPGRTAS